MLSISGRTVTVGKAQVLSDGPFCPAAAFLCLQVCKGHSLWTQLLKVKTLASVSLNSAPLLSVGRHQSWKIISPPRGLQPQFLIPLGRIRPADTYGNTGYLGGNACSFS